MEKRHRVFIAINLPQDIKKYLARYYDKYPELPAKWTAKDNLHITLEFLGYLTDEEIAQVCKETQDVARRHKSFPVNLNKVIYGPPNKTPKFIWAMGEKSKELIDLKNDLKRKEEIFTPHITLARISEWELKKIDQEEIPEINQDIGLQFSVESIEVMESELKRGGPVYSILESCELKN
jgi:2'-5' RNA ligase